MATDGRRGRLTVYLGAAPGVGKTVAMLGEARRRLDRGTDVVIAALDDHGREYTRAAAAGLPVLAGADLRGTTELDLAAVLDRRPAVALVDELARRNAVGSRNETRWQDVRDLLTAGVDVVTTVNIEHLESLGDIVAAVTGVAQADTVPDDLVRSADQVELVDMSPQALRRRMAHGHVYPAERIDTGLAHYFREGNLTALRELALLWVADRVDEGLERYRREHGITGTWAARERVVVALSGDDEGPLLLRRGSRIAGRVTGRDLVAVHVVRSDGATGGAAAGIEQQRRLAESLGGSFHLIVGDDIASAVLEFTRGVNGTRIVVGTSARSPVYQLIHRSTSTAIVRNSGDIDVHVVTRQSPSPAGPPPRSGRRSAVRWSWPAAIGVPVALAALMLPFRSTLGLPTVLLIFVIGVQTTALIGGILPAAVTAVLAGLLANLLFTRPFGSLTIAEPQNVFAILVFLLVGVTAASIVDRSRSAAAAAAKGRAEAQLLAGLANTMAQDGDAVTAVLDQARIGFGMRTAVLSTTSADPGQGRTVIGRSGAPLPDEGDAPRDADVVVTTGDDAEWELALFGHPLAAADRQLAEVVAAQVVFTVQRRRLALQAEQAHRLRQADAVRTAILAAVSHDLRNPLATIKASMSSLRDGSISWSPEDRDELLAVTDAAADQLDSLLANLLDLSRLQTGVLSALRAPVSLDEVVYRALMGLPAERLQIDIPDDLPLVDTDRGLLERVVANIVSNAVAHTAVGGTVRLMADRVPGGVLQLRVVDHGPGVPVADRERMFLPFQRLGDAPAGSGVGLGLAVARGLAEALDATIEVEDTPGGGLTMIIGVPIADRPDRDLPDTTW